MTPTTRVLITATFAVSSVLLFGASQAFAQTGSLSVNPTSGVEGSAVDISGSGFAPGESVSIWFGGTRETTTSSGSTFANANGSFSLMMSVPWIASGETTVTAQGNASGAIASASFLITSSAPVNQGGMLTINPNNALPGASIAVSGTAFQPDADITIYIGATDVGTVVSDGNGDFTTDVTVPNLGAGLVAVTATESNPQNPPELDIDTTGTASLSLNPGSGSPGTSIIVSGANFSPNETVEVSFDASTFPVTADGNGAFTTTVTAPAESSTEGMTVVATGEVSGRSASATFSDEVSLPSGSASLSVNPGSGAPNTPVALTGSGFSANETIMIRFGTVESFTTADGNGAFSVTRAAPSLGVTQDLTVTATGESSGRVAPASFSDIAQNSPPPETTIALSPTEGSPGTLITVNGSGYGDDENVTISFGPDTFTVFTNNGGSFSTTLSAPALSASENLTVTATGQSTGDNANATFFDSITNISPPPSLDYATLQAEIVALQQEVARLMSLLNLNNGHNRY